MNMKTEVVPEKIPESIYLKGLLARWLRIDDFSDDLVAPLDLVEATRAALTSEAEVGVVIQLSGGKLRSVFSNLPGMTATIIDYDVTPEAVADTQGMSVIVPAT